MKFWGEMAIFSTGLFFEVFPIYVYLNCGYSSDVVSKVSSAIITQHLTAIGGYHGQF